MGHMLPHAFSARGSLFSPANLEFAVSSILRRLYKDLPLPTAPQSDKTAAKIGRNAAIHAQYASGIPVPEIAKVFGISEQRVYQILGLKRRKH